MEAVNVKQTGLGRVSSAVPVQLKEKGPCQEGLPVPVTVHSVSDCAIDPEASAGDPLNAAALNKPLMASKGRRQSKTLRSQPDLEVSGDASFLFQAKIKEVQTDCATGTQAVGSVAELGVQKIVKGKVAANPFTLIGSDRWAGCPKSREDVNPASLKRARAVGSPVPRLSSKTLKEKGRKAVSGKGPSLVPDAAVPSGSILGSDAHVAALQGLKEALGVTPGQDNVSPMEAVSEGAEPSCLEQSDAVPMELSQLMDTSDQGVHPLSEKGHHVLGPDLGEKPDMGLRGAPGGP